MKFHSFILLTFWLLSCNTQKESNKHTELIDEKKLMIQLKKTPCYGECPIFVFQIYSDYTVIFKGIRFVDMVGTYQGSISEKQYVNLINTFETISFKSFDTTYKREFIADLPSIILTYDDFQIEIHEDIAPKELSSITASLEDLYKSIEWIKISDTIKR